MDLQLTKIQSERHLFAILQKCNYYFGRNNILKKRKLKSVDHLIDNALTSLAWSQFMPKESMVKALYYIKQEYDAGEFTEKELIRHIIWLYYKKGKVELTDLGKVDIRKTNYIFSDENTQKELLKLKQIMEETKLTEIQAMFVTRLDTGHCYIYDLIKKDLLSCAGFLYYLCDWEKWEKENPEIQPKEVDRFLKYMKHLKQIN